ncbi:hypothetical protein C5167_035452 [Papaver somniferum]|uniref:Ankyrin repeat domain-containing protein n=1 Tax=Papaver somniferum TaxID=3469 RepID=A0A4Y7KJE9_PAPSO|nr:ankyrin repeat domain-containing protein 13C-like [Papaver somniferum]RZC72311.1 hypothetical protein C5167_035452 [Papaver somniferum]
MAKKTETMAMKPEDYFHSPIHYAIAISDHKTLNKLLSTLPKLNDPSKIHTESDSISQEKTADEISSFLDRRDVPHRETPLHLAVRLNDTVSVKSLASAGSDVSLQNASGWNPLQEAVCSSHRNSEIALILLRLHHRAAWSKWRRRLPRLVAVLRRMRDFYMEISFHFESSIVPFVGKIAPSDTYRIWKRDGNLRADTSLAGFDGYKIQRTDQSFLFLGDGDSEHNIQAGSLLVLNRDEHKIFDAFENADSPLSESDINGFWEQTSVYRPGMDVTQAQLVPRMNWRRQEKTENVGEWKSKAYEIHNVVFSFRSRKVSNHHHHHRENSEENQHENEKLVAVAEEDDIILPLELDEDSDGFLVAENPRLSTSTSFSSSSSDRRRHSSFVRQDREWITVGAGRKSVDTSAMERKRPPAAAQPVQMPLPSREREYVKSLRPSVWLTEQFPLKTEEILPLLDILASKVKAVRRLRELLTTKFPHGTFPVKVAIPVVPTVRVIVTFTKFVNLQPVEQFYTPVTSPRHLCANGDYQQQQQEEKKRQQKEKHNNNSSSSSWLRRSNSTLASSKQDQSCSSTAAAAQYQADEDPFAIPCNYTWSRNDDTANNKDQKLKKSKSIRKSK